MGTRVALYERQSLDSEGTGQAIARQDKACRDYVARREGWEIVASYVENSVSASGRRRRPQFERMLVDARAGEFDVIVAYHLDRLTRSIRDYLPLLELAEKHAVGTTTVSGELDLTSDMGQTLAGVLAVFANGEIKRKGRRQAMANEQRAEQGRPSQGGRRAFGYETDGMTVRESEAMHVRDAYTALLAGASLYSIAAQLNDAGVTTTTGRAFTHNAVRQILANPRNAAIRRHRGVEVGPAAWPALVPESTFRSATSMLADESRRTNTIGGERRHLLTGVGLCGVCGDGTTVHAASRAKDTPIYVCRRSRHLVRLLAHVDEFVEETVLERLSRPDATELLVDRQAPDVEALNAERVRLVAEQSADMADMKAGLITRRQLHEANAITVRRIAEIDEAMSHRSRERVLGELARAADPRPVWASLSLQRRQAVLRELGDWVIYRGQAGGVRSEQRRAARVEWVPGPGITA